jgi:hypothetical protein
MPETSNLTVGGVCVSHTVGAGFSVVLDPAAARPFDAASALALSEWLRSKAHDEVDYLKITRWREERRLKRDEKAVEAAGDAGRVRRYWYGFYSRSASPVKPPPFPLWHPIPSARDTFNTLLDTAASPAALVLEYFPDARERWCFEKHQDWRPDEELFPWPAEVRSGS